MPLTIQARERKGKAPFLRATATLELIRVLILEGIAQLSVTLWHLRYTCPTFREFVEQTSVNYSGRFACTFSRKNTRLLSGFFRIFGTIRVSMKTRHLITRRASEASHFLLYL